MYEKEKKSIIVYGTKMDRYGLIALSGGNLTMRMQNGDILMTPSGMIYEDMEIDDMLVMDIDGNIIEGKRKPSSDTEGLLYILKNMPGVNGIIHTHQPYATAVGIIEDNLWRVNLTTLGNVTEGHVPIIPYMSPGSIEMGIDTVKYIGKVKAVILAHHGVITIGSSLEKAFHTAVYMEEAAKCYLAAKSCGKPKPLTDDQVAQTAEIFRYYGQNHEAIPRELLAPRI